MSLILSTDCEALLHDIVRHSLHMQANFWSWHDCSECTLAMERTGHASLWQHRTTRCIPHDSFHDLNEQDALIQCLCVGFVAATCPAAGSRSQRLLLCWILYPGVVYLPPRTDSAIPSGRPAAHALWLCQFLLCGWVCAISDTNL